MKYYIGKLETTISGYEAGYTFKFKTERDPDEYLIMVCSTFWGDSDTPDSDDGFSFFGGAVWVSPDDWQQIDCKTWENLSILNNINILNEEITA